MDIRNAAAVRHSFIDSYTHYFLVRNEEAIIVFNDEAESLVNIPSDTMAVLGQCQAVRGRPGDAGQCWRILERLANKPKSQSRMIPEG